MTIQNISIDIIEPSSMNPRKTFDEDGIRELAVNIEGQGLLQPITVRPVEYWDDVVRVPKRYEIVCGERRYRACRLIGMGSIPCIVREMSDDEAFDAMITENLQRKDVDPVEEADAFTILSGRGQTVADLAARFGRSESYIRDRMRLVSLIAPLRKALSNEQLPLRGAYLLARLNEEEQKEFADEELADEEIYTSQQLTTDDVTEWLDRKFRRLFRAPFQNGEDLREEWNPKGKYIRRCQTCDCNTANHGCLFADMNTDEPQCTDETCYNRKFVIYQDMFIQQYASRITAAGQSIRPGDVVLRAGSVYNDDVRKRMNGLIEKMGSYGWRVFTEKELPTRCWVTGDEKKKALKTGAAVEVIELDKMAYQYVRPELAYYRLASKVSTSSSADDPHFMVSRLCERSASIDNNAKKQITACAKKNFDKDGYVKRDGVLEEWEKDVLAAIIFDKIPWTEQDELIEGAGNRYLTHRDFRDFRERNNKQAAADGRELLSWTRRAIASYIMGENKQSHLVEAATQTNGAARAEIAGIREKADQRIDVINQELREMGYDEKGNEL